MNIFIKDGARFVRDFLMLIRTPSLAVLFFSIYTSTFLAVNTHGNWLSLYAVPLLLYGGAYAFNDAVDMIADTISRPDRPIPRRTIQRKTAISIAMFLFFGAVCLAFRNSALSIVYAIGFIVTSSIYSLWIKKVVFIKNVFAAFLVCSAIMYVSYFVIRPSICYYLTICGVLLNIGREIIMDVRDIEGDLSVGVKTLAHHGGANNTTVLGIAIALLGVLGTISPMSYNLLCWMSALSFWLIVTASEVLIVSWFIIVLASSSVYKRSRLLILSIKLYFAFFFVSLYVGQLIYPDIIDRCTNH